MDGHLFRSLNLFPLSNSLPFHFYIPSFHLLQKHKHYRNRKKTRSSSCCCVDILFLLCIPYFLVLFITFWLLTILIWIIQWTYKQWNTKIRWFLI